METTFQMAFKEQVAAVVAKIRADEAASVNETKYLFYEEKEQPAKLGTCSNSAIVLDDGEKEGDKDDEEASVGEGKEESTLALEQDSSTDDDSGIFDLNEEDVYVVGYFYVGRTGIAVGRRNFSRRHKESDLYLEGYNELTWEPDENIPRQMIEMFQTSLPVSD